MFQPPRCPYSDCTAHAAEARSREGRKTQFFVRHGAYRPKCRPHPVPRFLCKECGRTFSRQTFRQDYRDHKPQLNAKLLELLAHGMGLRQAAIILKLSRRCCELEYALASGAEAEREVERLALATERGRALGLAVHAGHGLTYENVTPVAAIPGIEELNIGHSVVSRAVLVGMRDAVAQMGAIVRRASGGGA